jgi:hypothetical protein
LLLFHYFKVSLELFKLGCVVYFLVGMSDDFLNL